MFKKYVTRLLAAATVEELWKVAYEADAAFQHDRISWNEHEVIFTLAARLELTL